MATDKIDKIKFVESKDKTEFYIIEWHEIECRNKLPTENLIKFFLQLLRKDASKRLGKGPNGSEMIKSHKWFESIDWKKLEAREIQPSFVPEVAGNHCVANFNDQCTNMPLLDSPVASPKFNDNPFDGFDWVF